MNLLFLFLLPIFAFAEEPTRTEALQDPVLAATESRPVPESGKFRSLVPLGGYNPTYKVFLGGGYFQNKVTDGEKKYEFGIVGIFAQAKATKLEINWHSYFSRWWRMDLRNELSNGFESNYGRGNETKVEDRVDALFWKDETEVYFPYSFNSRFSIGPGFEHRARRNKAEFRSQERLQKDPIEPEEFVVAAGIRQELDYRDIPSNPSLGWHQGFRITHAFPYKGPIHARSTTFDWDFDIFQYVINRDLVLAHALSGGFILGEPTYLNEFRLGGTDRLRGHFYNRFRGKKYYVEQSELRFPIYSYVSGASFLEFGEVTDKRFSRAHVTYGTGLRIGLPPDKISKIRIDYAVARDQKGVFVDFGHAF